MKPQTKRRRKGAYSIGDEDGEHDFEEQHGHSEEQQHVESGVVGYPVGAQGYWNAGYSFDNNGSGAEGAGQEAGTSLPHLDHQQLQMTLTGSHHNSGAAPNDGLSMGFNISSLKLPPDDPTVGMALIPEVQFAGMGLFGKHISKGVNSTYPSPPNTGGLVSLPRDKMGVTILDMFNPTYPPSLAMSASFGSSSTPASGLSAAAWAAAQNGPLPVPATLMPVHLRSPLPQACASAHLSHFLRYNYPIVNLTHPTYFRQRVAEGTCEPSLYWSALALASFACSHCAQCRAGSTKRAIMQRAGIELISSFQLAAVRPWAGPDQWYSRVQLTTALMLQLMSAFTTKNPKAVQKLRQPLAALLTDRSGIGIRAELPRMWEAESGRRWIEWEEGLRIYWVSRNLNQ